MHDKPSAFFFQADYEKLTITLKQKTISQISRGWDSILWTLALECGPFSFYSSIASCLSLIFVAEILRSPASFAWNNSKGETVCLVVKNVVWLSN